MRKNLVLAHEASLLSGASQMAIAARTMRTGIIETWILLGLTSLGVGATGLAILVPALTALTVTAVTVGLQMLFMPKPPKAEDARNAKLQPIPYRVYGIGTNRIAGSCMLWEAKNNYLYMVNALCAHRIAEIKRYWLNDDIVTLSGTKVQVGADRRYNGNTIDIQTRLGVVPETPYANVVAALSSDDIWTNDHRGDGQASLAMECRSVKQKEFSTIYPFGPPSPSVEADLALMWDWRDPEQDPEDPETWKFSKNAAVALAWQLCFNPFGEQEDYRKALLPVLDIWTEEADICDEDVPRASGGTEKRYEVNGWGTTETDPVAVKNSILAACDGWLCRRGDGAQILRVGKFREELVTTITDAEIIGHQIQMGVAEEEAINRLVPKFTYPATDYTTSDADFFEDVDAQIADGRVLQQSCELPWVHQWRQARRLTKREWLRIRERARGNLDCRLSAVNAVYSRWIRLDTPKRLPRLNGTIVENRKAVISLPNAAFKIQFIRHPENIDEWNPATDEGAAPPIPPRPTNSSLPAPTIDTINVVPYSGAVVLEVIIIAPNRDDLTPITRYRVADIGTGAPGPWIEQRHEDAEEEAGLMKLATNPVPPDVELEVQAAFDGPSGSRGPWSPSTMVTSIANPNAPQPLVSFTAVGGLETATFSFETGNDPNVARVALYRAPAGAPLNKATHLFKRWNGITATTTYARNEPMSAGSWDFYAVPENASGVEGAPSAALNITVSSPS